MPWHAIFAFVNPLLIGVLQVKAQGAYASPFDTHPGDMWTFLVATLLYCFAFAANIKCHPHQTKTCSRISATVALLSGSLSSVALLSIFLPPLLARLIFFSWTVLPLIVARQLIHQTFHWLFQWARKVVSLFLDIIGNRFKATGNLAEHQPRPPV